MLVFFIEQVLAIEKQKTRLVLAKELHHVVTVGLSDVVRTLADKGAPEDKVLHIQLGDIFLGS